MKKSIIKFNVFIFTGLLGLGLMTSPIDAEEGQESRVNEVVGASDVIYTSTSSEEDPLKIIYLTVPSQINLAKNQSVRNDYISISLDNGKMFNDYHRSDKKFKTIVDVSSKNNGKLRPLDQNIRTEANYILRNTRQESVDWNKVDGGKNFIIFDESYTLTSNILKQLIEVKINESEYKKLESEKIGEHFSDILIFKISLIQGYNLKSYNNQVN